MNMHSNKLPFLCLLFAPFAECLGQPLLSVNPKVGPPTSNVSVSGSGFGANETIDLYFDTDGLAVAQANANGTFIGIPMTIPASAKPGAHWITGVGQQSRLRAQTRFVVRANWPQFSGDSQHHSYNPTENILSVSTVPNMVELWTVTTGSDIQSSPAVVNGTVYFGGTDGNLYAVSASTGEKIWTTPLPNPTGSSPAVIDGVVYISAGNSLYAFSAATGKMLWSAVTGGAVTTPTVANGVIYVGSADTNLYAFSPATGQPIWTATTSGTISNPPAVADGIVCVASNASYGTLYAFNAATGQPIWNHALLGLPNGTTSLAYSAPAVSNGLVYLGDGWGTVLAFGVSNGELVWYDDTQNELIDSIIAINGVAYVGSADDSVYALEAATGRLLWSTATGSFIVDSPALANGVLYVGSCDNKQYALNAATGEVLWTGQTGNQIYSSSPAVANGMVFVGSADSKLYAFGLKPAAAPDSEATTRAGRK
jgi:outer membrane protein assembly factor BamB